MRILACLLLLPLIQQSADPAGFPGFSPYDPEHDTARERPEVEAAYVPATVPDTHFPLRVQVLATQRKFFGTYYLGSAIGNLAGQPQTGLAMNYRCRNGFASSSDLAVVYQARWIKPNERIELLLQKPGTTHTAKCEVLVKVQSAPYRQ